MNTLWTLLQDPNMQWILISCTLLGLSSGIIGCFSYLRKQSLMGDTLAHAALPGICIAFMLTGTKSILYFLIGAGLAGVAATFGIGWITRHSRIKHDAAMGIVLSSFFGLGIVLLTLVQHGGYGNQAGLDKFLFGQAASMVGSDVLTLSIVSLLLVTICYFLFKQFKLVSFDPGFAKGIGYPVALLEQLLMFLMVVAVVVGIQAVGVILVASLIITPAVSARYWTDRLGVMVVVSGLFGAISGASGAIVSSTGDSLPTGPLTVLAATLLFALSLLFGTKRGILVRRMVQQRMKRSLGYGYEEQAATASVDDRLNKEASL
ncbi:MULTISPECIES: metal ABC transporter permease [unclassified Paenibacillus]|uniref:metal ABC transporter permease n=1 Tax=unclassified Paenibacillus TaxID=185978 RepID=UPI001053B406|nr:MULTISPECIES: metal ABC transporter permease [unclassified Paenibacillus]NIK70210.1 manganese/zinc/iron transport system permease protein [Paenibacillus sp. BK720]TCM98037.1 manganese/zinc/iron transport system permease protein [Paenibacillus sp. BK033]